MKYAVTMQMTIEAGSAQQARDIAWDVLSRNLPLCQKCGYVPPVFGTFNSFSYVSCERFNLHTDGLQPCTSCRTPVACRFGADCAIDEQPF